MHRELSTCVALRCQLINQTQKAYSIWTNRESSQKLHWQIRPLVHLNQIPSQAWTNSWCVRKVLNHFVILFGWGRKTSLIFLEHRIHSEAWDLITLILVCIATKVIRSTIQLSNTFKKQTTVFNSMTSSGRKFHRLTNSILVSLPQMYCSVKSSVQFLLCYIEQVVRKCSVCPFRNSDYLNQAPITIPLSGSIWLSQSVI